MTDQQLIKGKKRNENQILLSFVGQFTDQCWLKDALVHVEQVRCLPESL